MATAATRTPQTDLSAEAVKRSVSASPLLELILLNVRLRAQRRAAWLAHLANVSEGRTAVAVDDNLAAYLDGSDTPAAEAVWYEESAAVQLLNAEIARVEQALAGAEGAQLQQLRSLFGLSDPELALLQTCLAPAIDPILATVYAWLQQHPSRGYATETLAARLFGYGRRGLWHASSPLAMWGLVTAGEAAPGEPAPLVADPPIIAWLQGDLHLDAALVGVIQLVEAHEPLASWPVEATVRMIEHTVECGAAVRVLLAGPPASGRRTFAAAAAAWFGMQTLAVDTSEITDNDWPQTYVRAQRLAVLSGMALAWHGSRLDRLWPRHIAPAPIQFVACNPNQAVQPCDDVVDHYVEVPAPTLAERRGLWQTALPASSNWPVSEFEALVTRYRLNVGDIVLVARRAPTSAHEATGFARELTRQRLGELGQLLDCPFKWDDLVLPPRLCEGLEDFVFEARDRVAFWEQSGARRMFPRGRGLVALFSGPPGTGKTMAAQIVAADLELDLFRVDLATAVSKYIGETAKHLAQIFARAARMNAVLLFDEADALFSKRTEVKDSHDRYANADTSYLLQLLEEYRGIVILATNKRQNIDPAFLRRMRYIFEFPRPDAAERGRIWRQVIGELSGDGALPCLDGRIDALAETVELTGAQIKNSVLAAMFAARRSGAPLATRHLLRGIERELGKEGRAVGTRERERLLRDG